MSNGVVAFLFAAGGGVWVYSVMMRRTGGNTQNAAIVGAVAAVFGFIFMLLVLAAVENWLS